MSSHAPLIEELRVLTRLALPVIVTQVGWMLLGVVDTMMVGGVSTEAVAAAVLGNTWMMGVQMFAMGVIFGMDPLVSQAHGARNAHAAGIALQRGLLVSVLVAIPTGLSWLFTTEALVGLGQDPALAHEAERYALANLPGLLPLLAFIALRQYLQGRAIVRPAMWLVLAANVLNVFLNWVLVYGNLGAPALGLVGSGYASSIGRVLLFLGLALWVARARLHEGGWDGWSREALRPAGLGPILSFGLPTGVQLSLEIWCFHVIALWAGRLGGLELATHGILINMASLTFMVPLGISAAAATRVGNLIGAGRPGEAQRSAWVALAAGALTMTVFGGLFVLFRHELPRLYVDDDAVVALAAVVLPIGAAFQVSDGAQVVGGGILRGMGRTRPAAAINLLAYWGLGLPIAWWLAFPREGGLPGLWWGLAAGLTAAAALTVAWIWWRGPARASVAAVPPRSAD